ncbi:phosphoesterase [Sulfurifustis variabilis]|uniref:undecaprenyl-diphosphate phosphatase n=1 Tax=Sulfurifustis variabilis TaxID=1675686 RepID=A0A1B4VB50_9GAMM|nr:phosphatase PAP2 family protein [Sulfurifustis variabilis]BAU47551.1 phosphoesterase [Sulfurifustis variabilis]
MHGHPKENEPATRRWAIADPGNRREVLLLALALVVVLLTWSFAELADEVAEGDAHRTDEALLLALRSAADLADPIGPKWLEELARDFTALGGVGVLTAMTLAVAGFLALQGKRHAAVYVLLAVGTGLLAAMLLKGGYSRPRPALVPHASYTYTSSFPSGHAMMSAVVYLTLGALLARFQPSLRLRLYLLGVAVVLSLLVGVTRVYLGVHWPTDVLAGWLAGAAWASLCWLTALLLQRQGRVESEPEDGLAPP